MAIWIVRAKYKKSTVEREFFSKDGATIVVENGWRGGSFSIETDSDDLPDIYVTNEAGLNIYDFYPEGVVSVEMQETYDGCWMDIEFPEDMPEEEQERIQELIDDGYYYDALEEEGFMHSETEMWLHGPLVVEDEDGNVVLDGEENNDA